MNDVMWNLIKMRTFCLSIMHLNIASPNWRSFLTRFQSKYHMILLVWIRNSDSKRIIFCSYHHFSIHSLSIKQALESMLYGRDYFSCHSRFLGSRNTNGGRSRMQQQYRKYIRHMVHTRWRPDMKIIPAWLADCEENLPDIFGFP